MPEHGTDKNLYFPPAVAGAGDSPLQTEDNGHTNAQLSMYIKELKKVNEELTEARRAVLNMMEDAILSAEALKRSEEKYRAKLEQEVRERTAELKMTKENLQRSNEDLKQFAHAASHDLKEPVRKIKTFNSRIIDDFGTALPEKVTFYIEKIGNAADRMLSTIDGILNYSKMVDREQLVEPIDLNKIIYEVVADLEIVIQEKKAQITATGLLHLPGYRVLLHQLFYNLILNSLKFAKASEPPLINITCELFKNDTQKFYKIVLADNGIGFEQEYAETIFGTFNKLNPSDEYEGTGLGLALCKKIVHRHRGHISADGEPGNGATFTVLLPAP